jgi:hypothetical protein
MMEAHWLLCSCSFDSYSIRFNNLAATQTSSESATILVGFPPLDNQVIPMRTLRFWPLDDDPDDPIYDSPAWDLPGYRSTAGRPRRSHPTIRCRNKKACL